MEETGLEIELGEIVAAVDMIERDRERRIRYHYTLIDFIAEAASPELRPGSDAADARWFEVAEVAGARAVVGDRAHDQARSGAALAPMSRRRATVGGAVLALCSWSGARSSTPPVRRRLGVKSASASPIAAPMARSPCDCPAGLHRPYRLPEARPAAHRRAWG